MRCLAVVVLVLVTACRGDHGAPRVRPLPTPDKSTPLRGGGPPRSPRIANYHIDAKLDTGSHQITATQTLTWTNSGQSPVESLPFHLYLNAFKNEASLFWKTSRGRMRGAKATDTGWGWIAIESVQLDGVELVGKLAYKPPPEAPQDQTVAELALPAPVLPGATIKLAFKFTAQLPEVFARTGYKGEFHLVGQWFPKIGVRVGPPGSEHWECQPFHANNEFFADFGVYDVSLTVPSTYVVAATGVLAAATESPGGTRTFTYHAHDVHDFVWMADPYMETMTGHAKVEDGTVEVRVVYRPAQREFAKRHRAAAIGTIERFSAWFVPYPWAIMTVVDPPPDAMFGAGGMEYPTLVTTAGDSVFTRPGVRLPEYVTVHEVGHNWFQGILASNEPVEAWLDEGVNDWADALAMNDLYGARASIIDWMGWHAEIVELRRAVSSDPGSLPSPIATAAYAFVDNEAYSEATYSSTMRALRTLENHVGPSRFAAAMKVYAKTWAFKHPTGRDLFETLERELGQDLGWFFGPVFHQVGGLRLGLRTAECRKKHPPRGVFDEGKSVRVPTTKTDPPVVTDNGVTIITTRTEVTYQGRPLEPGTEIQSRRLVGKRDAPDTGSYICEVVVANTGTIHVPVDIDLKFEDGSTQRVRWEDHDSHWQRFVIERSSKLAAVWIDPDNKIALDQPMTHHYRIEGDGSAALRAGAWFAATAQTLMQLVGP